MRKFRGKDIFLFANDEIVGGCLDCSFDGNAEMISIAGEDGEWEEYECGRLSWQMSSSHLLDAGNARMILQVGNTIKVAIAEDREDEKFSLVGDAIVSRAQIQAQHKDLIKGSFSFIGNGKLSTSFGVDDEGYLFSSDGFALVDMDKYYLDAEEEEGELFSSDGFALADFQAYYLETTEKE